MANRKSAFDYAHSLDMVRIEYAKALEELSAAEIALSNTKVTIIASAIDDGAIDGKSDLVRRHQINAAVEDGLAAIENITEHSVVDHHRVKKSSARKARYRVMHAKDLLDIAKLELRHPGLVNNVPPF